VILVDTSVWIDHLRGTVTRETILLDQLIEQGGVLVGDLVMFEVLQGARHDADARRLERDLRTFRVVTLFEERRAAEVATTVRSLRSKGITIRKAIDILIATWCIASDVALLHADADFVPFVKHCGLRAI
jgi:predicted nucleic acid-binding protein